MDNDEKTYFPLVHVVCCSRCVEHLWRSSLRRAQVWRGRGGGGVSRAGDARSPLLLSSESSCAALDRVLPDFPFCFFGAILFSLQIGVSAYLF